MGLTVTKPVPVLNFLEARNRSSCSISKEEVSFKEIEIILWGAHHIDHAASGAGIISLSLNAAHELACQVAKVTEIISLSLSAAHGITCLAQKQ